MRGNFVLGLGLIGATAALALLGRSSSGAPNSTAPRPLPKRVLLVGDSYAVGLDGPLTDRMAARSIVFASSVQGGTSVVQWVNWIDETLEVTTPELVLVSLGANDYARTDGDRVESCIEQLVRHIRSLSGARAVWIEPVESKLEDKLGVRDWWIAAVGNDRVPSPFEPLGSDGIHPTAEGYRDWAGRVDAWIASGA